MYDNPGRIPTGWFEFDLQIGGGFPIGKVTEIFGMEASMKTTATLKAIASAQRLYPDKTAVFIDIEGHLDRQWAAQMGVNVDTLYYVQPDNTEQTIDLIEGMAYASDVSVIVLDSIAAMVTQSELDKSAADVLVGTSGLAANKLYRRLGNALGKQRRLGTNRPTILFINQLRHKMVSMGNPEVTPGGNSFKFISVLRIRMGGSDIVESDVNKHLPAFKKVSVILKKHKVPVLNVKGEFQVATIPIPSKNLKVGQSDNVNPIIYHLSQLGLFVKGEKKGYLLIDASSGEVAKEYETKTEFKTQLVEDVAMSDFCQGMIFSRLLDPLSSNMLLPE